MSMQNDINTGQAIDPEMFGAGTVRDRWKKGLAAQRSEHHQYWLNHAFLMGEQWIWFNPQTRQLDQLARDPDRVQMTVNRMWPASRTMISRAVSRPIVWDVPPSAADDATIRSARTAESILTSLTREHNWEGLREEITWATWKGGTAAIAVEWDPSLGQPLGYLGSSETNIGILRALQDQGVDPAEAAPPPGSAPEQQSTEAGQPHPYGTGDTVETALSIVDFVVEPGVRDAEKARWWIKAIALPPEQVQAMFGLEKTPAADASAGMTPFQSKLLAEHAKAGDGAVTPLTNVFTYYERPNPLQPEGRMMVVVADEVLEDSGWPFPFRDHLNIAITRETVVPGRWTGESVLKIARPIQSGLNQAWSSIIEHMKQSGNARLMVPESALEMMDSLTDLPGELIPVPDATPNDMKPSYLSPPNMPGWWIQQPEKLAMEMDNVLGIHDPSRGQAPVNIESGVGLSILIEQDQSPIGRLVKDIANAFGRVGQMVLEIYQENVAETRQAVIKTPGQPPDTTNWTGGDLMGQVQANIPIDAVMPRSRAQQLEFAKQAMQLGLIGTIEQFVKVADLPDQRDILEAVSPDVAKARRENQKMAQGHEVIPATFDIHTAHIQEHLTFMKGPRWDNLTPDAQRVFILHNTAHEVFDAENLGRMQQKATMSPLLAAAADKNGTPTLPWDALGKVMAPAMPAGPPGAPPGGPPGEGGPGPAPTPNDPAIGSQNPEQLAQGKMSANQTGAKGLAKSGFKSSGAANVGGL